MLADAVVSLGYLATRPLLQRMAKAGHTLHHKWQATDMGLSRLLPSSPSQRGYTAVRHQEDDTGSIPPPGPLSEADQPHYFPAIDDDEEQTTISHILEGADQDDAPESQLISTRTVVIGLILSISFCVLCIHTVFGSLVPLYATITAVLMALVLSIMGVRALGETDLNPVSGISKSTLR